MRFGTKIFFFFFFLSCLAPVVAPPAYAAELPQAFVVKFKAGIVPNELSADMGVFAPLYHTTDETLARVYVIQTKLPFADLRALLVGQYEYLEPDRELALSSTNVESLPNDPGFSRISNNIDRQWGLHSGGFVEAWKLTTGYRKVVVAIIDTGVDMSHEDFKRTSFVPGYNVLDDTTIRPGTNADDHGHGTLVAGIIAADTNNHLGIAGAAPSVKIMPIKVLRDSGTGKSSKVAKAVIWATDHGASVVNLSLGGSSFLQDKTLADAIAYAFRHDVVVVAAAGNDSGQNGENLDEKPVFPICHDNGRNMVIGVTAIDVKDQKPPFANYGKSCIDVVAPGKRILSTANHDPASGAKAPNAYAYASGTSLAVPFVSAQAALLKSLFPEASSRQIRDRIIGTATNIDALNLTGCGGTTCAGFLGAGRINVAKSLAEGIQPIVDQDLVRVKDATQIFLVNGFKRQPISEFVIRQRYDNKPVRELDEEDVLRYPEGTYALPKDGTLVKTPDQPLVYYIAQGTKLPITNAVFRAHGFDYHDVVTLTSAEINSWTTGKLLLPPTTFVLRTTNNPTIYWPVSGVARPVSRSFYDDKGLSVFPALVVSEEMLNSFPIGEPLLQ